MNCEHEPLLKELMLGEKYKLNSSISIFYSKKFLITLLRSLYGLINLLIR